MRNFTLIEFLKHFNFPQKDLFPPKLIFFLCSHIFKYTEHDNFMSKSHYTEYIFKFQSISFIVFFLKKMKKRNQRTAYACVFHIATYLLAHVPLSAPTFLKNFASVIEISVSGPLLSPDIT